MRILFCQKRGFSVEYLVDCMGGACCFFGRVYGVDVLDFNEPETGMESLC